MFYNFSPFTVFENHAKSLIQSQNRLKTESSSIQNWSKLDSNLSQNWVKIMIVKIQMLNFLVIFEHCALLVIDDTVKKLLFPPTTY